MRIDRGKDAKYADAVKPSVARKTIGPEESKLLKASGRRSAKSFGYSYSYKWSHFGKKINQVHRWFETEKQRDQAVKGLSSNYWFKAGLASDLKKARALMSFYPKRTYSVCKRPAAMKGSRNQGGFTARRFIGACCLGLSPRKKPQDLKSPPG